MTSRQEKAALDQAGSGGDRRWFCIPVSGRANGNGRSGQEIEEPGDPRVSSLRISFKGRNGPQLSWGRAGRFNLITHRWVILAVKGNWDNFATFVFYGITLVMRYVMTGITHCVTEHITTMSSRLCSFQKVTDTLLLWVLLGVWEQNLYQSKTGLARGTSGTMPGTCRHAIDSGHKCHCHYASSGPTPDL